MRKAPSICQLAPARQQTRARTRKVQNCSGAHCLIRNDVDESHQRAGVQQVACLRWLRAEQAGPPCQSLLRLWANPWFRVCRAQLPASVVSTRNKKKWSSLHPCRHETRGWPLSLFNCRDQCRRLYTEQKSGGWCYLNKQPRGRCMWE